MVSFLGDAQLGTNVMKMGRVVQKLWHFEYHQDKTPMPLLTPWTYSKTGVSSGFQNFLTSAL